MPRTSQPRKRWFVMLSIDSHATGFPVAGSVADDGT